MPYTTDPCIRGKLHRSQLRESKELLRVRREKKLNAELEHMLVDADPVRGDDQCTPLPQRAA